MNKLYICPVCGYDKLEWAPAFGFFKACPCCQYSFHDTDYFEGIGYDEYRSQWIRDGMPWGEGAYRNDPKPAPAGYDPLEQLKNLQKLDPKNVDQWEPRIRGVDYFVYCNPPVQICEICGYDAAAAPYDLYDYPFCLGCLYDAGAGHDANAWREQWIADGRPWRSKVPKPANWPPR